MLSIARVDHSSLTVSILHAQADCPLDAICFGRLVEIHGWKTVILEVSAACHQRFLTSCLQYQDALLPEARSPQSHPAGPGLERAGTPVHQDGK